MRLGHAVLSELYIVFALQLILRRAYNGNVFLQSDYLISLMKRCMWNETKE